VRDEELKERIQEVHTSNYRVYGARKIWRELNRQGHAVARCTVERLMRELGITGAVRGKKVITTLPGGQAERAPDLLDRDFVAAAPNRCWVADFTHVKTWAGVVYVAFVVDTFSRRIVGWSAATVKETVFVLDALMESTTGLYKTELIKPRRPWKSLSQVELATAEWVDWYNHRRLHGEIGHVPPVEYEANHYMESTKPQVTTII
jgi:putative transposase